MIEDHSVMHVHVIEDHSVIHVQVIEDHSVLHVQVIAPSKSESKHKPFNVILTSYVLPLDGRNVYTRLSLIVGLL